MVYITQEQIRNRVDALLGERLALAQQNFTEEIWRIGDNFNAKGMLGGSAFNHAVLHLGESEIRKSASLIENTWREALNAFKEAASHLDSGFLSKHAEEKLREFASQIATMIQSIQPNKDAGLFVRLEEQLSRSVDSLAATLDMMLAEIRRSCEDPLQLEEEQYDLLAKFVEAHRSSPAESRAAFFASSPHNQPQTTFVHSRVHGLTFQGSLSDAEILADFALLRMSYGSGNYVSFSVLPKGISVYEKRKGSSPPLDIVSVEPQKFLSGVEFRTTHAVAFAKWEQAAGLLWAADSPQHLTTIGHYVEKPSKRSWPRWLKRSVSMFQLSSPPRLLRV
jgi:hypothetical protein